jgi:hypothetical protein
MFIMHLQSASYGFVQALCEITDVLGVETSHRDTSVHSQVYVSLFHQRLALTRIDTREPEGSE